MASYYFFFFSYVRSPLRTPKIHGGTTSTHAREKLSAVQLLPWPLLALGTALDLAGWSCCPSSFFADKFASAYCSMEAATTLLDSKTIWKRDVMSKQE